MTDARRRVLVLGGYGLIGLPVVRRLIDDGHEVCAMARDGAFGRSVEPRCVWLGKDIAQLDSPDAWATFILGMDVVVNASGALQTGLRDNLVALQFRAIEALAAACGPSGTRIVQISAPGAALDASTEFMRTKALGDACVRGGPMPWVIVKPGVVISPEAYGGTALLRMLAAVPLVTPIVLPNARMATVAIGDVVEVVARAVDGRIPSGSELVVTEAADHSLEEVVLAFRHWLGAPSQAVLRLPSLVGSCVGLCADGLGWLGWRSPLRSTALRVLKDGVTADARAFEDAVCRPALDLESTLRATPSTVQERWFARMYLAVPVMLATLSAFWLASGIIALCELAKAVTHLTALGLDASLGKGIVVAGSLVDIVLGVAVFWRRWSRAACLGMVAVTASYLAVGSVLDPALWADPIGPYVKTIPASVLAWVGSSLVKSR